MSHYEFKPGPYSSHTLLLNSLPREGCGRRVLDLGCGDGHLAGILAARGFHVIGIERVGGYAEPFPEVVELIEGDLEDGLPSISGPFSYLICADVLEHLRDPLALLGQLRPLLAPDGRLLASLPNSGHFYFRLNVLAGRFPQQDRGLFDRTHLRFFMWTAWRDLFTRAGFEMLRVEPTTLPFGVRFPALEGGPLVRALEWSNYGLARLWKELFAYQFVVEARAKSQP